MFCPYCGAQLADGAKFCDKCGKAIDSEAIQEVKKKDNRWLTAVLLCFFLGSLGIHRFYTGRNGSGVAMILTLGGCGIWALVDFVMLLLNTYTDVNGKPLK